jgi:uncharacterized membrane protein YcaP (DUF421 family)
MFFDGWWQLGRVLTASVVAYLGLVVVLRASGKRTLAKLSAFDFVVTVALGSTLATIVLSSDVAISEGLTAFCVLVGLQFCVAWLSARSARVRGGTRSDATYVVLDGEVLQEHARAQRLSDAEIRQAVRSAGIGGLELVAAVILEADGTFSVVSRDQVGSGSALPPSGRDVSGV